MCNLHKWRVRKRVNQEGLRGQGRTSTEAYVKGHGVNGQLRYVTHKKVSESGSVPSTLLKRLPRLTIRRRCAFVATRPSSTFLTHLLRKCVQANLPPPSQLGHSPPPSLLSPSPAPCRLRHLSSPSPPPSQLSHPSSSQPSWVLTQ